eukprot:CAMPEP_0119505172 /NCGR_PEP_ID=MMETSP1344-20130328/25797_1 /TAXON_ID=236787 /ORGANISM="Florenciella parvula, Strain CCMP2471" /LENGTH=41 /DNA_ID= /DNA_START= /DNA_END= /DNA_ORIENTATION=
MAAAEDEATSGAERRIWVADNKDIWRLAYTVSANEEDGTVT